MVDWKYSAFLGLMCISIALLGQELPQEELQVNFSSYFDNFQVTVIYPNFSLTRHVSESTSITGRYLVDLVSAASIRSNTGQTAFGGEDDEDEHDGERNQNVDVVTTASGRGGGENPIKLADDVRNEYGLGVSHIINGGTVTLNGLYSSEHDYSSSTLAGTFSRNFAQKNTTVEIGFVRSWDKVFPITKDWTRDVNVSTVNATFSQILSKKLITQFIFSYSNNNGQLADVYKTIKIASGDSTIEYDPVHPHTRVRRAAANRFIFRLNPVSSFMLGYRYYWDSWNIHSQTISGLYQRHLTPYTTLGVGLRSYVQNKAFFFKETYTAPEQYMTADNKLDRIFSTELELKLTVDGGDERDFLPFLDNDRVQYNFSLNWYQRHTNSPDWYSGRKNLTAIYFNIGLRYLF